MGRVITLYARLEVPDDIAEDVLEGEAEVRLHALRTLREAIAFDLGEVHSLSSVRGGALQARAEVSEAAIGRADFERLLVEERDRVRETILAGLRSAGDRALQLNHERSADRRTTEVTGCLETVDLEAELFR